MKKLLSALMVFCLLLTMVPMSVWAETVAKPQKGFELNVPVRVNPVYASTVDPQQLEEELDALSSAPVFLSSGYVTETEAAAQLREQMTRRVNNIVVKVKTTNNNANEVFNGIFDRALEHTGQPTEGDYLAWQYGGAGVGSGYDYDWDGQFCYYTLPYQITYYSTAAQEAELDAAIAKLLSQWNTAGKSDYEKVSMINDYITETVYYDDANLNDPGYKLKYTAYAAMIHKTAVCQGYANLFYRLALSLDVDCRIVVGWGYSGSSWGNHAWNLVEIDGTYYYSDSTWDASWAQAGWSYPWFLLGSENMGKDHEADPEYAAFLANYNISKTDYAPGEPSPDPEPTPEWPKTGACGNNMTWTLTEDGVLTLSGTGSTWDYADFDPGWYDYRDQINKCVIEEGVTRIGNFALFNCTAITSVEIPNSVTTFGEGAFAYCTGLSSLVIPDSVTHIGRAAFYSCTRLTSITIPNSVTFMGADIFSYCENLTSVKLPDNITALNANLFGCCYSLTNVTIPDSVTFIDEGVFYACESLTSIEIPEGVSAISAELFLQCCNLTTVTIPSSVTSIGEGAFAFCDRLTDIYFGGSEAQWAKIGIGERNEGLANATIHCAKSDPEPEPEPTPEWPKTGDCGNNVTWSLTEDGVLTLSGTGPTWDYPEDYPGWYDYRDQINKCIIEEGVTTIGDFVLFNCPAMTSVEIPNSVISFGEGAFAYCENLTNVEIPDSVTIIGPGAFAYCRNLTNVEIPDSVTIIDDAAFFDCRNMTSVEIPDSVTYIGVEAFSYCTSLTSVEIPNGLTRVSPYAFAGCSYLTTVTIPSSVTHIDEYAFSNCNSLKDIYYEGTAEQWAQVRIDGTNTRLLYVNFHFVVATHMPGDINGDGKVNSRDATRLFQYLAEWDVAVNEAALDVNGDGKVNSRDATRLFQYLAGWDVEIY